jgi:transcriptional regulator with XRE-family HTH domain
MSNKLFLDATVAKALKAFRLERGISQEDLAHQIGAPQSFVSKYESLERRLIFSEVCELCSSLDKSYLELVTFINNEADLHNESSSKIK